MICSSSAAPSPIDSILRRSRTATKHALVADTPCDAVGVEPLEQELRGLPARADEIAEPRQRDASGGFHLRDELRARVVVGGTRDREPVADADEPPLVLEQARECR